MNHRLMFLILLAYPILAGFDCGSGGETRLEACVRLGNAYCSQEIAVGCQDVSIECVSDNCYQIFDSKCLATDAEIEKIDHDIKMIVQSKQTCDALRGVDDYLLDTIGAMATAECVNGGSYDTRGQMCAEIIQAYCEKSFELGCISVSVELCVSVSWPSGLASLGGGYVCTDPEDDSQPTPVNIMYQKEALAEIKASTSCG